ncbi:MAG TPA: polysaccharide deacetylase family protein [Syntrophomonadaceae bacterium]|nr:polysaccharide deacetylase family protein [Syntrophomonadaceae bacterium]
MYSRDKIKKFGNYVKLTYHRVVHLLQKLLLLIFLLCFTTLTFTGCVRANKEKEVPIIKAPDTNTPDLKGGSEKENRDIVYSRIGDAARAYPGLVFLHGKPGKKQVALTFDDGPDNYYTPQIPDILKSENVKATFFVVGERVKANPNVMKKIVSEGHFVGNHTWDHPKIPNLKVDDVKSEVQKTEDEISQYTGYQTAMFRPPYGIINSDIASVLSNLNYKIIEWSSDSQDWKGYKKDQVESNILSNAKDGAIILQHCAGSQDDKLKGTVQALPLVIETLKDEGITFVTVPELLELPGKR